ncbi:MAG TPA: hypothetical protein VGQ90_06010 [Stellaceae bacterium]|jgi:hypothetical protein|nr:hypothetical protein [Stellaceae bacterium]
MLGITLMRAVLAACSILFGSLGVFFVYLSCLRPELGAEAVVFLIAASASAWSLQRG